MERVMKCKYVLDSLSWEHYRQDDGQYMGHISWAFTFSTDGLCFQTGTVRHTLPFLGPLTISKVWADFSGPSANITHS